MTVHHARSGGPDMPVFMTMRYSPVMVDRMAESMRRVTEAQLALVQAVMQSQFAFFEAMFQGMALPGPQGAARRHEPTRDQHRG